MARSQWSWAGCLVASNYALMELCGHDTATMAKHAALTTTVANLIQTFVGPMVGCLSDTVGRVPVQAIGKAARLVGVFLLPHCRTLGQRKAFEIVLGMMKPESGLFMAGHDSVFDAARADLFGRRPELGAQIQAKHALWATAAHGAPPTPVCALAYRSLLL